MKRDLRKVILKNGVFLFLKDFTCLEKKSTNHAKAN